MVPYTAAFHSEHSWNTTFRPNSTVCLLHLNTIMGCLTGQGITNNQAHGMQGQSAPWPEIPLSPMARGGAGAADQDRWHAPQDPRFDSLSADEDDSEHSDPAHTANPRTPVSA